MLHDLREIGTISYYIQPLLSKCSKIKMLRLKVKGLGKFILI